MTPDAIKQTEKRNTRKGWMCKQSFSNDFVILMENLYKKYGEKIFDIQGIANKHTDIAQFSRNFFQKSAKVADASVDPNGNVKERSVSIYVSENNKAIMRLNSFYLLFKYVKKFFDEKSAEIAVEKVINGELFINDFSNYSTSYCFAFDLRVLLSDGLSFFKGNMPVKAPKRTNSFLTLLIQAISYISNQIMGACSFPDFFPVLDHFLTKDYGADYLSKLTPEQKKEIENHFQSTIYSFNWPYRSGQQSPFVNLSVMDRGFVDSLFDGYDIVDGENVITMTEERKTSVIKLSQWFFEYFNSIFSKEGIFTFPVMTLAISVDDKGKFLDKDFVDWVAKVNSEKSIGNVFISKPTSFASCCFSGEEMIEIMNNETGIKEILSMKTFVEKFNIQKSSRYETKINSKYSILSFNPNNENLEFVNITGILEKPNNGDMIRVETIEGNIIEVTPDHVFLVKNTLTGNSEEVTASDLSKNPDQYELIVI